MIGRLDKNRVSSKKVFKGLAQPLCLMPEGRYDAPALTSSSNSKKKAASAGVPYDFASLGGSLVNTNPLSLAQILGGHSENFALIGLGLIVFILAVALCRCLLDWLSKMFETGCDWLEYKLARRRVWHRSCAHLQRNARRFKHSAPEQPALPVAVEGMPKKSAAVLSHMTRRRVDAREALRRSCSMQPMSGTKFK